MNRYAITNIPMVLVFSTKPENLKLGENMDIYG